MIQYLDYTNHYLLNKCKPLVYFSTLSLLHIIDYSDQVRFNYLLAIFVMSAVINTHPTTKRKSVIKKIFSKSNSLESFLSVI